MLLSKKFILIYSANTQNARSEAEATVARFKDLYPTVPVNMVYELPNFKVMVGYFLTSEEALVLWGKIKGEFDRALVIRADITLDDLKKSTLPQEASTSEDAEEAKPKVD